MCALKEHDKKPTEMVIILEKTIKKNFNYTFFIKKNNAQFLR